MAEFQRKIELQSPDDLQYLVSNIRRAANVEIDKNLPPIEGEDKMRTRVEELVHVYITQVFTTASENLTINGLNPSPTLLSQILSSSPMNQQKEIEEHEPFNTRLFERAKDLARQEEDLIEEIAALRRTIPGVVTGNVKREYREGIEGDERILEAVEERVVRGERGVADLGIERLERQEQVEASWGRGVKGLEGLMKRLPEVGARKERAERAEEYVVKGDRR
ncbi:uncharacterized protein PAC_07369 [Phialocephala subalpina]|uniref:Kinetochore protein mis14 n=1 Tax=Phialocephala subalpina TaxID=576137 RepID=A0A1L7WXI9_9HELO|nr:uncharacterized protein PAC_07369 [Phialocephala subalpina]